MDGASEGPGVTPVSPQVRLQHQPEGGDAGPEPRGPGVPPATDELPPRSQPLLCPAASREPRLGLGKRGWVVTHTPALALLDFRGIQVLYCLYFHSLCLWTPIGVC